MEKRQRRIENSLFRAEQIIIRQMRKKANTGKAKRAARRAEHEAKERTEGKNESPDHKN